MKPLRSRPLDFRASFIALGWGAIEQHYGAHATTVRRWVDEEGRETLIAERAAYVARLRERDRAFRRRAAALGVTDPATAAAIRAAQLGTDAGLSADVQAQLRDDQRDQALGATRPPEGQQATC